MKANIVISHISLVAVTMHYYYIMTQRALGISHRPLSDRAMVMVGLTLKKGSQGGRGEEAAVTGKVVTSTKKCRKGWC